MATARPLISTVLSPFSMMPPAEFRSPTRCTAGMCYPIKILLLRTGLIPVVASR